MKKLLLTIILITNTMTSYAKEATAEIAIQNIPKTKSIKHQVMTLGVFHFDREMDGSDVIAKNHMDVMSEENQKQIDAVVNKLISFKPKSIAIEWKPENQTYIDKLYAQYLKGDYKLDKNETFQIGFRVAKALGIKKLHCVDTNPPVPESMHEIDSLDSYAEKLGHHELWKSYDEINQKYLGYTDNIQKRLYLIDYLKLLNSSENQLRRKQLWTTGLINIGHDSTYVGADLLGRWYKRNARIFATSKNLVKNEGENLLIIYGNAHKWILDELFESHPEFELVQFSDMMDS